MRLPSPMGSRIASSMALTPRTISAYAPWNCSGLPRSESWPSFELDQARQFLLQTLQHDGHVVDRLLHLLVVALVGLGNQLVDLAVRNLRQNAVAFADGQQNRVEHGVHAAHDLGIRALELLRLAAIGELAVLRCLDQPRHLLLQALQNDGHVVDGHFHLFVVALVGLGDQLVDLAVGDLRQNAVAFADGQQNRVQHGVDAAHNLRVRALELFRLAAVGELAFLRRVGQPGHLLLQALQRPTATLLTADFIFSWSPL